MRRRRGLQGFRTHSKERWLGAESEAVALAGSTTGHRCAKARPNAFLGSWSHPARLVPLGVRTSEGQARWSRGEYETPSDGSALVPQGRRQQRPHQVLRWTKLPRILQSQVRKVIQVCKILTAGNDATALGPNREMYSHVTEKDLKKKKKSGIELQAWPEVASLNATVRELATNSCFWVLCVESILSQFLI